MVHFKKRQKIVTQNRPAASLQLGSEKINWKFAIYFCLLSAKKSFQTRRKVKIWCTKSCHSSTRTRMRKEQILQMIKFLIELASSLHSSRFWSCCRSRSHRQVSFAHNDKYSTKFDYKWKSVDGVLRIWTRDPRLAGVESLVGNFP